MTNKEIIEVVTAAEEGKQIEWIWTKNTTGSTGFWRPCSLPFIWNFEAFEYRVKPREGWVMPYDFHEHNPCCGQKNCIHVREVLE